MRLNTRRRMAVDAMLLLAQHQQAGPVALASIARHQRVALSGLEQVFSRLRVAGLVHGTRGSGGGYTMGRDASDISVADIVGAIDNAAAKNDGRCPLANDLLQRLESFMQGHMAGLVLADLLAAHPGTAVLAQARPRRSAKMTCPPATPASPMAAGAPNSVFELGSMPAAKVAAGARAFGR